MSFFTTNIFTPISPHFTPLSKPPPHSKTLNYQKHPQNSPFLPFTHNKDSIFTPKNYPKLNFRSVILLGSKKDSNFIAKSYVKPYFRSVILMGSEKDSNFLTKNDSKPKFRSVILMGSEKNDEKINFGSIFLMKSKKVSNFLSKNGVKILIGAVILMGSLKSRYTLASPMEKTRQESAIMNENDEEMYEKILEKEPRNIDVLKILVNLKMRKGLTKEALKYVEMLIRIEPEQVEWRLLQALCYEMMGQFGKAKMFFKDILKQQPLLLRALHGLAMVKHKNHEGPAVFDMLNQALELAQREKRVTEERNIKILIAQMHLVQGNLNEASEKYQELITENPRDFRPYLCQGIIYSLEGRRKEADEQFEIYKNLVPEEFPQRGFLEDVVLSAKTESREQLEKDIKFQVPYKG